MKTGIRHKTTRQNLRLFWLVLGAMFFALSSVVSAQPARIPRVGYLTGTGDSNDPGPFFEAFRQGLRNQGYTEGKNIVVEHRYVEGRVDRIPSIVAELVQLKVDALVLGQLQRSVQPNR